ncbi:xylene monooxygenase [Candidatus Woesearchaeota archaeon CG11_big_fil_rev_8_21_14_0_20_43_8]|nr:MAG: xylene monooxygenase [Candidatus Woesearchaeota archaeon CG11_big_fil_rev_8_21_14_0_20_43_8]PIO05485.1 MAG: xylene monooxygenase [Candidatus Woesearchaeota archaeon CG08_land_8_20_14_0_20_43_7]
MFTAKITKIIQETHDVKTFRLERPDGFDFISGQFALVSIVSKKELGTRPLTFSSSPTEKKHLDITVKELGIFTKAMSDLFVGDSLSIDGPRGETLNFDEHVKDDIVYLVGGSGITPFMSALRYAIAKGLPNRFILLFGNRTQNDRIFEKELRQMDVGENITVVDVISCADDPSWTGECGHIDRAMIEKYVPDPKSRLWYVCGPPSMVNAMQMILGEIGIEPEKIKIDKWQLPGKGELKKSGGN